MVNSPAEAKRRFSDQTLMMNISASAELDDIASSKRRQSVGGNVRPRPSSTVPADSIVLPTPTKRKVNLGSTAASAYYFSGIPKTPVSTFKSPGKTGGTDAGKALENTYSDNDDSTQSAGAGDIMNKSVLSDTTELTASNFVRVASSRMQVQSLENFYSLQSESLARTVIRSQTQNSSDHVTASPSSHSKVSTSPRSLRTFTRKLKQSRLSSDEGFEQSSTGSNDELGTTHSFTSPIEKDSDDGTQKSSSSRELDVSLASLDDLFDGLLCTARMDSPETSLLTSQVRSPLLEAAQSSTETGKRPRSSFLSPEMSPIDRNRANEIPFRLTPSKISPKLTPTKLNRSPRRVLNLNAADSPARNTRSACKSTSSVQVGLTHEIDGHGVLWRHCSPARDTTCSSSSGVLNMDDEGASGRKTIIAAKYSSDIKDSKRSRVESEFSQSDYQRSSGKKIKAGSVCDEGLPIAGGSTLRASKSECTSAPKSILNSTKKKQSAPEYLRRKTVAFGSPEAAEYHIGSPSISLTPMPPKRAKAMFSIPSDVSNVDKNSSVASVSVDATLLEKETNTVDIDVDVHKMLENTADYLESDSQKQVSAEASGALNPLSASRSFDDRPFQNEFVMPPNVASSVDFTSDEMNIEDITTATDPLCSILDDTNPVDSGLLMSSIMSDRANGEFVGTPSADSVVATKTLTDDASTDLNKERRLDVAESAVESAASSPCDYTDEDNTVELEADLSSILAMASQGSDGIDSLPALKLADRFPKTMSALVPTTLRLSFGNVAPSHLRDDSTPGRLDFGLSESPAAMSAHSCRRRSDSSRRRFSLARTGRLSIASEGSLLDVTSSVSIIEVDGAEPYSSLDVEEIEEQFTISCKEIYQLVGPSGCLGSKSSSCGFQSSIQSLCAHGNARYSQVSNSIFSFALAVCREVEEKAQLNSDAEACFSDLVESVEDEKFQLQRWLRNQTGRNETKSIAAAIRRIVNHEWSGWEKIVLDSLRTAIAQIGAELEPESCQLEECMTALYHLHDLLSISAGKAARRARRRSMARHEVSMHVLIKRISV